MQKSLSLLLIILVIGLILVLVSCAEPANTVPPLVMRSTPSPTSVSDVIDENTINQLKLLHQWDIGEVLFGSTFSWFSDSKQLIIPSQENSVFGIQSFGIDNFDRLWFRQIDFPWAATVDKNDHVITYFYGLHTFNKQGEPIKTITTPDNCGERLADYIVVVPGTDLIITGHQDAEDEGGLNNPGLNIASLVIWDVMKESCSTLLKGFDGRLFSVAVSPDGHYIGYSFGVRKPSYSWLLTTKIYDLKLRKETCDLDGSNAQFNNQNQLAVYNPDDNTISVVKPSDCKTQLKFDSATKLLATAFSPNRTLLVGVSDSMINIWNARSGEKLQAIDLHTSLAGLPVISFSPDSRFLVITKAGEYQANKIMLWGVRRD